MNEIDRHPIACPDAEMLAAWFEGDLRADERSRIEEHAAACGRCQAHLAAIARMATAHEVPRAKSFRLWPWLVPAAGAAAAATIWVVAQPPAREVEPLEETAQVRSHDEADKPMAAPEPSVGERRESRTAASSRVERAPGRKLEDLAKERRDRLASDKAPAAAAPAAPPPAPPAGAVQESVPRSMQARAADAAIVNLVVQRSPDGRVTWETEREGIYTQLLAGVSPSPSVFWLVGKSGLVLLSTDSRSWRRLPFPEPVDLTGVQASSDTAATVTSADARVFTTVDGGATWQRR